MAQTLTRVLLHLVFSTKNRDLLIAPEWESEFNAYMGGICRMLGAPSLAIGGTAIFHDYNRTIDQDRNLEGFIHNACASVAILGIVVATVLTGLATREQPDWKHLSAPAGIFALGAILAGISFQTGPDARDARTLHQPPVTTHDFRDADLSGVTLGVHPAWFEDADADVVAQLSRRAPSLPEI